MKRLTCPLEIHNGVQLYGINTNSDNKVGEITQALGKYEDAEEQGLLLRLPCKVGDVIYRVDRKTIYPIIGRNDFKIILGKIHIFCDSERYSDYVCYEDIGKTVFFTQKEAEQRIKELESEELELE